MRNLIGYLIMLMCLLKSCYVYSDVPNQVSIHYSGVIVSQPCSVSVSSSTVDLGDVNYNVVNNTGGFSGWGSTTIKLTDCDLDTGIKLGSSEFSGRTNLNFAGGVFALTTPSTFEYTIGMQVMATINGKDYDMYYHFIKCNCGNGFEDPILVYPTQRTSQLSNSLDMALKFRLIHANTTLPDMNVTGIVEASYSITIEYI